MNTVASNLSNCTCQASRYNKKFANLEKQLKEYKAQLQHQKTWTKFVGEWLLHKFGFDIQLRIQMHNESLQQEDSDSEDDNEEQEDDDIVELVQVPQAEQQRAGENTTINVVSYNKSLKRRRTDSNSEDEATAPSCSSLPIDTRNKTTTQTNVSTRGLENNSINFNAANTMIPIKREVEDICLSGEQSDCNYDNQLSSYSNVSRKDTTKTMITKTGHVVSIVRDDDPNVDIKYNYFPPYESTDNSNQGNIRHMSTNESSSSVMSLPSAGSPSAFGVIISKLNYSTTYFDLHWILQMKKHQSGIMPYSMFIKRDDIRQWFEYLVNPQQPSLSRYRCRLCYVKLRELGYPRKYWGPMEDDKGQMKKNETDNRNTINLHVTKQSHKEIMLKLTNDGSREIGPLISFTKVVRKQLLDSLENE